MTEKGVYGMFLSFVVPVYNAAQYLPECLDSLLAQDISDYEIICVTTAPEMPARKFCGSTRRSTAISA